MKSDYQIREGFTANVIHVGNEQTPVLIIDDFLMSIEALKQCAYNDVDFKQDQYSFYPGCRTRLPDEYANTCLNFLLGGIRKIYQLQGNVKPHPYNLYYSLITLAEQDLVPLQRIPHFDTNYHYHFAILHYLDDKPHGGTGLFRHKQTGFERINEQRKQTYFDSLQHHFDAHGEPEAKYCIESNELFELYHQIDYKPNRLVIYPGNLLHSTIVNTETDVSADPKQGRLTANMFVDFK
ncbi:DUF6445 family protein [Thalassotalea sp. Y01]|uniref:DUF6445 family protein n=1 Tax=Thalassotalea sp. Y01 TaxID=2729613 RepID=UPI00145ECB03|nr:DUF6445 family protein [Thalassotalea sp. Y01]NMP16369.1 hypothetical protein [Thalassotalea sp. Y01]